MNCIICSSHETKYFASKKEHLISSDVISIHIPCIQKIYRFCVRPTYTLRTVHHYSEKAMWEEKQLTTF